MVRSLGNDIGVARGIFPVKLANSGITVPVHSQIAISDDVVGVDLGNGKDGVLITDASGITIGDPNSRSTISNNGGAGIHIQGPDNSTDHVKAVIRNSVIGTGFMVDPRGLVKLRQVGLENMGDGVFIDGSPHVTIGGTTNPRTGTPSPATAGPVSISSRHPRAKTSSVGTTSARHDGNHLPLDLRPATPGQFTSNVGDGVLIETGANNNTIGGNVISGNMAQESM